MPIQTIPPRIRWAVELMDVQPNDQVVEIGCGPGAGAELICSKLESGKLFAIDRSELVPNIVKKTSDVLARAGFRVSVVEQKAPAVVGIIGRR